MRTLPAPTSIRTLRARRASGVRMGWIRRPEATVSPPGWLGDVNVAVWYEGADLPGWINGRARSRLIVRLALAEVSLALLGMSYVLMSLPR